MNSDLQQEDHLSTTKERDRSRSHSKSRKFQKNYTQPIIPSINLNEFMSFRAFIDTQPSDVDYRKARQVYDQYKKQWNNQSNQSFFQQQRHNQWFKDKYLPERQLKTKQSRILYVKKKANSFFENIQYYSQVNWSVTEQQINDIKVDGGIYIENSNQDCVEVMVKDNIDLSHQPYFAAQFNPYTIYIRSIPPNISHWDLLPKFSHLKGFKNLLLSEPIKIKDYIRYGWIEFENEQSINEGLEYINSNLDYEIERSTQQRKVIKVGLNFNKEQLRKDIEISKKLIIKLDSEYGISNNGIFNIKNEYYEFGQLDLQVLYLRMVHTYCYWSGAEFSNDRILISKCGSLFLRILQDEGNNKRNQWQETIQQIALKRIKKDVSCLSLEERYTESKKKLNKKQQWIYGCDLEECNKQFLGGQFLLKHIKSNHTEEFNKVLLDYEEKVMFENFNNESINKTNISQYASNLVKHNNKEMNEERKEECHMEFQQPMNYVPYQSQRQYRDLDNTAIVSSKKKREQQQQPQKEASSLINYNDI